MGAICLVVLMAILAIASFILSVAEIVMGSIYINGCPIERYIPIYLVVSGVVGVVLSLTSGSDAHKTHKKATEGGGFGGDSAESSRLQSGTQELQNQSGAEKCWSFIRGLLSLFAFIWMICGMYWVLHVYRPFSDPGTAGYALYCNPSLYTFALVMVFLRLALIVAMFALTICVCCGIICCAACMA